MCLGPETFTYISPSHNSTRKKGSSIKFPMNVALNSSQLTKVSVSSLVFQGYRPFETLCISSLWLEKSKQEPKISWIWPYTSFNSCGHQQFAFSDPHWVLLLSPCWLQCCWKKNANFCKWENSVKSNRRTLQCMNNKYNIILINKFRLVHSFIRNGMAIWKQSASCLRWFI